MARQKGMLNLSGNLEPLAGAPLDSRSITPTVTDLYIASNWPYKYIGMKTTVTATGDTYRLVNLDVTQESSWVKEGSGNLSDLNDVDLINPEEGETLVYDGKGGWTNGPAGQTYTDFTGATSQSAGSHGLVPAPTTGDISKFLKGDGTWATVPMPSFDYSNTSPEANNYSTDEKVIGTWIDRKPLYQKTVSTGVLPNSTVKAVAHNVSNVDKVCDIFGFVSTGDQYGTNYPLLFRGNDSFNDGINLYSDRNNIIIYTNKNYSNMSESYVTLQYTKTTDSPVASGEKIVGQWIDGKPVFEKVVDCGALPNNTFKQIEHNISNLDKIVFINGISFKNDSSKETKPISFASTSGNTYNISVDAYADYIYITTGSDRTGFHGYVTIRYTKTT